MIKITCALLLCDETQGIIKKITELESNYKHFIDFQSFLSDANKMTETVQKMIAEAKKEDKDILKDEDILKELKREIEMHGISDSLADKLNLNYKESIVLEKLVDK